MQSENKKPNVVKQFYIDEPAMTGYILSILSALLGIGVALGLDITPELQQAIIGLAGVVLPGFIMWFMVRNNVTPVAKLKNKNEE